MILALEKDDASLHLFASVSEAETHFEAIDVQNGEYEFCDERGQRLAPEIVAPITTFGAGSYRLRPMGAPERALFSSLVSRARYLSRGCGDCQSLEDLKRE
jgi:hypothetical protein